MLVEDDPSLQSLTVSLLAVWLQTSWMRAARTDKGVSAVGQVVSLRMRMEIPNLVDAINSHLPAQVQVMGVTRVTAGFDARKLCDRRRYEYIMPAWVFNPAACVPRTDVEAATAATDAAVADVAAVEGAQTDAAVDASQAKADADVPQAATDGQESATAAEPEMASNAVSAEGRGPHEQQQTAALNTSPPPPDARDPQAATAATDLQQSGHANHADALANVSPGESAQKGTTTTDISHATAGAAQQPKEAAGHAQPVAAAEAAAATDNSRSASAASTAPAADDHTVPMDADNASATADAPKTDAQAQIGTSGNAQATVQGLGSGGNPTATVQQSSSAAFVFDQAKQERLTQILQKYCGTRNFHNFTIKMAGSDPAAKRYMLSFECKGLVHIKVGT